MVCVQKSPVPRTSTTTSTTSSPRHKRTIKKPEMVSLAQEFSGLRAVVPSASSSDLETVLAAIEYIQHLRSRLEQGC